MNYILSATTDIGNVKETNQDSFNVRKINTKTGEIVFAILCDGMGGLSKGEVASSTLVNAFCKWANNRLPILCEQDELSDYVIKQEWSQIAIEYNEKIKLYGKKSAISLGTTLTAMLITDSRYYIINVGDTRAYEIAEDINMLTKDQTVVAREVELGNITAEQAETDSRRSVLLQCIGASDNVYPDMFFGTTKKNAVYMLCSDGFRHLITKDEIYQNFHPNVMLNENEMKQREMFLIKLNKERQERDNITVVNVRTF